MIRVERTLPAPDVLTRKEGPGDLERRRVAAYFGNNGQPAARPGKVVFKVYKHRHVKQALEQLFGGKCAYCESNHRATSPTEVEHWRPKGAIITGEGKRLTRGYHWLASEWSNLLPSCQRCNREERQVVLPDGTRKRVGKANHFPLADETRRATAQEMIAREAPLLLDPCTDLPDQHLEFFERDGQTALLRARNESARGQASIDIYGLNRAGLVLDRQSYQAEIEAVLNDLRLFLRLMDDETRTEAEKAPYQAAFDQKLLALRRYRSPTSKYCALARSRIDPELRALGFPLD